MAVLDRIYAIFWGPATLAVIIGMGIFLTLRSGFAQLRLFPMAMREFFGLLRPGKRERSSFRALCTALGATVGTGNLAGVAGGIALGGPGAIFWMWVSGLFGMAVKFSEAVLAVRYRLRNEKGDYFGGPMVMIRLGMGERFRPLAALYSVLGIVAAFGVGSATQVNALVNAAAEAMEALQIPTFSGWEWAMGALLAGFLCILFLGGMKRIGEAAELLVPFASLGYMLLCMGVIVSRSENLPAAVQSIFVGAFTPQAVTGGAVSSVFRAAQTGVSRGIFSNEAGMGTAAIAHAGADVDHPVRQGLMGIMEVFLDTFVICTLTALAILCSGEPISYGVDDGAGLTQRCFCAVYGRWAEVAIAAFLSVFTITTILGWGIYGAACAQYLFGRDVWRKFVLLQAAAVVLGAGAKIGMVWRLSEIVNILMVFPNLFALFALSPELKRLVKSFRPEKGSGRRNYCRIGPESPAAR